MFLWKQQYYHNWILFCLHIKITHPLRSLTLPVPPARTLHLQNPWSSFHHLSSALIQTFIDFFSPAMYLQNIFLSLVVNPLHPCHCRWKSQHPPLWLYHSYRHKWSLSFSFSCDINTGWPILFNAGTTLYGEHCWDYFYNLSEIRWHFSWCSSCLVEAGERFDLFNVWHQYYSTLRCKGK